MAEDHALEPQLKEFLVQSGLIHNLGDDSGIPVERLRAGYESAFTQAVSKIPVKSITTQTIPGMDFNEIPIRIYQPADVDHRLHRQKGLPILLYLHGGGFFGGTLDTHDDLCRNLGRLSGYIVLSVAYRLAPEHKFPLGHRDVFAAANWACDNASTFGGDASHIAVGGDSAGGSLAAALCHMARDNGGPKIALQVLLYPTMQPTAHYTTDSMEQLATSAPFLSKRMMEVAYDRLVEQPEDQKDELLDLNHAPNMTNLAPAYVVTAEFDPLRDEGEMYASRLSRNGVPTQLKRCEGACHGFIHFNTLRELTCATTALQEVALAMRQAVPDSPDSIPS